MAKNVQDDNEVIEKTGRQKKLESFETYRLLFVIPRVIGGENIMEKTFKDAIQNISDRTRFDNFC